MNKEFVPNEQALALRELGFDEPCFGYYGSHQIYFWTVKTAGHYDNDNNALPAPLYQQAFRFFREKYKLRSTIIPYWIGDTYMTIIEGKMIDEIEPKQFQTYEEAELACLIKLIEIVKQKQ